MLTAVLVAASATSAISSDNSNIIPPILSITQLSLLENQLVSLDGFQITKLAVVVDRLLVMTMHVSLSVVVLQIFTRRKWWFLVLAILFHTTFKAIAILGISRLDNIWFTEALLFLLNIALILIVRTR